MNEINKPEHGLTTPEQQHSAAEMRAERDGPRQFGTELDQLGLPKNNEHIEQKKTFNSEATEQPKSAEQQRADELDKTSFESYEKRSFVDSIKDVVFGKESSYNVQRYENAGIQGAFDELPRERREAVYERFENAPIEIKKTVNDLSGELSVENTNGNDCCHYDLYAKKIRMEADMDNAEYAEVFSHEYGHFVDNSKGDISDTYDFRDAISKDLATYDKNTLSGRRNFDNMMDDLFSTDAAFDRAISDNMSAFFANDSDVTDRYRDEGIPYYQHDNSYWAVPGNREAEIYANSFSMSAQDNKASCNFMGKYFPNTWEQFNISLSEEV